MKKKGCLWAVVVFLVLWFIQSIIFGKRGTPAGDSGAVQIGRGFASESSRQSVKADSAYLSYSQKTMNIFLTMDRSDLAGMDTAWVWASFISTENELGGSWSDEPIPVLIPEGDSPRVKLKAVGPAHWTSNSFAPKTGFYARVHVSRWADSVVIHSSRRDDTQNGMTRVESR